MATTTVVYLDLAQLLADKLDGVAGLRAYPYVADTVRPPAAVVGQPEIDYLDQASGFCAATYLFPVTLVVARNSDRAAQQLMAEVLHAVVTVLTEEPEPDVLAIEPVDARPIPVTLAGQELPGYLMNVRVRA